MYYKYSSLHVHVIYSLKYWIVEIVDEDVEHIINIVDFLSTPKCVLILTRH